MPEPEKQDSEESDGLFYLLAAIVFVTFWGLSEMQFGYTFIEGVVNSIKAVVSILILVGLGYLIVKYFA